MNASLDGVGARLKQRHQLLAECLDDQHHGNGDEGEQQAIFRDGEAILFLQKRDESSHNSSHFMVCVLRNAIGRDLSIATVHGVLSLPVMSVKMPASFCPKFFTTTTTATATSASSKPYSVTASPSSDFRNRETCCMTILRLGD